MNQEECSPRVSCSVSSQSPSRNHGGTNTIPFCREDAAAMEHEAIRYTRAPPLDAWHFLVILEVSGGLGERNTQGIRGRALGR